MFFLFHRVFFCKVPKIGKCLLLYLYISCYLFILFCILFFNYVCRNAKAIFINSFKFISSLIIHINFCLIIYYLSSYNWWWYVNLLCKTRFILWCNCMWNKVFCNNSFYYTFEKKTISFVTKLPPQLKSTKILSHVYLGQSK